jgi:quercetin dioxygenase-like cupin family protein
MDKNQLGIQVIPVNGNIPSEGEAEAKLHKEGYESFRWHDVPGASYPNHRHSNDECIWVLKGEMTFKIVDQMYQLKAGDRIYLPAKTPHEVAVPSDAGVTYLVGQRDKASSNTDPGCTD